MAAVDPASVVNDSTLEDTATALGAYLDQQVAIEGSLTEALVACRARISRARKAIEVLTPEAVAPAKEAKKPGKSASRRRGVGSPTPSDRPNAWTPSPEIVARTLKALETLSQEHDYVSISQIVDATGMAGESIKRALSVLRDREQARFLGRRNFETKTPGRTAKAMAFKLMPTHAPEPETPETELATTEMVGAGEVS